MLSGTINLFFWNHNTYETQPCPKTLRCAILGSELAYYKAAEGACLLAHCWPTLSARYSQLRPVALFPENF